MLLKNFEAALNQVKITFPASEVATSQGGLVESQRKIVKLIKANPKISKKEMAENIGISTTAIDKHIRSLREKSIIKSVGSDRTGHWELLV